MRVALYGESAFAYYLVAGDAPSAVAPPSVLDKSCYPTQATLDYVRERMPYLTRPVHCLVPKWERCTLDDVHLHGSSYPYRSGSFLRIDHVDIVSCPELCFLQLAQSLDLLPLIQAGCFLCGTFGLDPSVPSGLMGRTPLTSPRRIGAYLERCQVTMALHVHGRLCGLSVPRQHRRLKCSCDLCSDSQHGWAVSD